MLKGIKIESIGMALMVIFCVIIAIFNVGTVDTKSITPLASSKNTQVEYGIIDTSHGKIQVVNLTTPYGQIQVSQDTYNKIGKEQIIADLKEFKEFRSQYINGKLNINPENTYSNAQYLSADTSLSIFSTLLSTSSITPLSFSNEPQYQERSWFFHRDGYYPNQIYGVIKPSASTVPSTVKTYDELEILSNTYSTGTGSTNDCIELISDHDGGQVHVWINMAGGCPEFLNINSQQIEYFVNYNSGTHIWYAQLYNPATGLTKYASYSSPATYVNQMTASTELYYSPPTVPTFHTGSVIEQWVARSGSMYYYPTDLFTNTPPNPNVQYVNSSVVAVGGHFIDTHTQGSDVA